MKPLLVTLLFFLSCIASAYNGHTSEYDDDDETELPFVEIKYATDFSRLAETARIEDRVILLEISASYCDYCRQLEEEFIKPMLRNADYIPIVLIRKIDLDSYYEIKDFTGDATTPAEFARRMNVQITPTLLFFDGSGNEVSQRILGINSLDLYGGYIDDALINGLHKIKSQ